MKKLFKFVGIAFAGVLALASCKNSEDLESLRKDADISAEIRKLIISILMLQQVQRNYIIKIEEIIIAISMFMLQMTIRTAYYLIQLH